MKNKIIQWLLDRLDADHILTNTRKRGWVPVPCAYAIRQWPKNVASGWWPVLEDEVERVEYFEETRP